MNTSTAHFPCSRLSRETEWGEQGVVGFRGDQERRCARQTKGFLGGPDQANCVLAASLQRSDCCVENCELRCDGGSDRVASLEVGVQALAAGSRCIALVVQRCKKPERDEGVVAGACVAPFQFVPCEQHGFVQRRSRLLTFTCVFGDDAEAVERFDQSARLPAACDFHCPGREFVCAYGILARQ